jgi:hypothetical protein
MWLDDVRVQPEFEAAPGDLRAQFVRATLRLAVHDEFQPGQQAPATDVADDLVAQGDVRQAVSQERTERSRALIEFLGEASSRGWCAGSAIT